MALNLTPGTLLAMGNTYPARQELKDLGGRWQADLKAWTVPARSAEAARALATKHAGLIVVDELTFQELADLERKMQKATSEQAPLVAMSIVYIRDGVVRDRREFAALLEKRLGARKQDFARWLGQGQLFQSTVGQYDSLIRHFLEE